MRIEYSNNTFVERAVVDVWDDLHTERSGYFRAFWAADPINGHTGSPVMGYCSSGGSHRTIRDVIAEVDRFHPGQAIYRNGRLIRQGD